MVKAILKKDSEFLGRDVLPKRDVNVGENNPQF
jgi:hypothetical protein